MNATSLEAAAAKPTRSRKRILVPLAGLLVAAAITAGSGADFVSNSVNTGNAYNSGTLLQSNSKAGTSIFNLSNVKPGDTVNGKVTIANTGTLDQAFTLTENAVNGFATKSNLSLVITQTGVATPIWSGTFADLTAAGPLPLGVFAAGESREYIFSVTLAQAATNAEQGKSASATYTWNGTQTAPTVTNQ
ncbi:TasA family protein [Microbacterium sp. ARD31]|uniref:TasA family protein n=1 Tax=Microbacterium sp. ARD31 TaxID=2962576 RepID=UPI002881A9D0|nr:TasA family protein [Microbacterium sp. ARD31]MDT0184853.1 TasA family protein [Microbacterium sp. ARD31]